MCPWSHPGSGLLSRVSVVEDQDRRIVDLLRADGRMSYTDLGKAMGRIATKRVIGSRSRQEATSSGVR